MLWDVALPASELLLLQSSRRTRLAFQSLHSPVVESGPQVAVSDAYDVLGSDLID